MTQATQPFSPASPVFYCVVHLGEFMVSTIMKFSLERHITRCNVTFLCNKNNLLIIKFAIPVTKCMPEGEDAQCAPQHGCITDLAAVLKNHFRINPAPASMHLFAWKHLKGGLHPLSKNQVTTRITAISKKANLTDLKGHSLCIGGTLFYLLRCIPFDIIKVMGQWAGKAFTIYLRHHTLILAPFLQEDSELLEIFNCIAMPPVC
ncbi:hypothetical protein BS17DRAFT_719458 [Gyrodon lividus]|nr:hypothetical protein BS17DRAFT_719458 [Gyrodon lividus]